MTTVRVELPADLVRAADLDEEHLSEDAARFLALLLYREEKISLGRAAELSGTSVEAFMDFAGRHGVPLQYGLEELDKDRLTMARLGI
jgi:predicted HTH domain antitoxin